MPSADEFDASARDLEHAAASAELLVAPLVPLLGQRALRGGELERLVTITLDVADRTAAGVANELRLAADEARRRAEICRAHTAEIRAYERALDSWRIERSTLPEAEAQPPPRRPRRPPSWVDR